MKTYVSRPPVVLESLAGRKWLESLTKLYPRDVSAYRHAGTVDYVANRVSTVSLLTTMTTVFNVIYFIPFISPFRIARVERVGIFKSAGGTQTAKFGIYTNRDDRTLEPANRIYSSPNVTLSGTGYKYAEPNFPIPHSTLLWVAIFVDGAVDISALQDINATTLLGCDSSTVNLLPYTHRRGLGFFSTIGLPPTVATGTTTLTAGNSPSALLRFSD